MIGGARASGHAGLDKFFYKKIAKKPNLRYNNSGLPEITIFVLLDALKMITKRKGEVSWTQLDEVGNRSHKGRIQFPRTDAFRLSFLDSDKRFF